MTESGWTLYDPEPLGWTKGERREVIIKLWPDPWINPFITFWEGKFCNHIRGCIEGGYNTDLFAPR